MRDIEVHHPGVQHSGLLAYALHRQGRLAALRTRLQIGLNPPLVWNLALRIPQVRAQLSRRLVDEPLPDPLIDRFDTVRWAAGRINPKAEHPAAWQAFGSRGAKRVQASTSAVVGSDHCSLALFRFLLDERPDVKRILDVAHPPAAVVQRLIREDVAANGLDPRGYDDTPAGDWEVGNDEELELADHILVASSFTRRCLEEVGVDRSRISVAPYGVSVCSALPTTARSQDSGGATLRLVFVGNLSERKGASLLLRAMADPWCRQNATLTVVGSPASGSAVDTPSNVAFTGRLARSELQSLVASSDCLVLPSMCEGFGRVILEALALGTPVLATERSVAPDVLSQAPSAPIDVIPCNERSELARHFERVADGKASIHDRRAAAVETAASYSIPMYGRAVAGIIDLL